MASTEVFDHTTDHVITAEAHTVSVTVTGAGVILESSSPVIIIDAEGMRRRAAGLKINCAGLRFTTPGVNMPTDPVSASQEEGLDNGIGMATTSAPHEEALDNEVQEPTAPTPQQVDPASIELPPSPQSPATEMDRFEIPGMPENDPWLIRPSKEPAAFPQLDTHSHDNPWFVDTFTHSPKALSSSEHNAVFGTSTGPAPSACDDPMASLKPTQNPKPGPRSGLTEQPLSVPPLPARPSARPNYKTPQLGLSTPNINPYNRLPPKGRAYSLDSEDENEPEPAEPEPNSARPQSPGFNNHPFSKPSGLQDICKLFSERGNIAQQPAMVQWEQEAKTRGHLNHDQRRGEQGRGRRR
ncbi:hypothetical protein BDV96DRAFT_648053 [Lophiotrema nucula]|uniref:Uncharacterized protein n=1 Tax=Lophiotrema nucula TaxID=690887 RepID=A0A6A5Z482_9PLEO|nr:hypothetical protein BDV96DRAFT_648053 [Lophiotrema nucula]